MTEELPDWAKSIIAQAMMEIQKVSDIDKVVDKVECTAVRVHKESWKAFKGLVKSKRKMLESSGRN